MDWACQIVESIIAIAPVVAVIVAVMALSQTKNIATRQIMIMEQEWKPRFIFDSVLVRLHLQEVGYDDGIAIEQTAEQIMASLVVVLKNTGRCNVQYKFSEFTIIHEVDGDRKPADDYIKICEAKGDTDWLGGYAFAGSDVRHQTDGYIIKRDNFYPQDKTAPHYPNEIPPPSIQYTATCIFTVEFWEIDKPNSKHSFRVTTKTNAKNFDTWTSDNRVIEIKEV